MQGSRSWCPGLSEHLSPELHKGWARRPCGAKGQNTMMCSPLSGNQQTQSVPLHHDPSHCHPGHQVTEDWTVLSLDWSPCSPVRQQQASAHTRLATDTLPPHKPDPKMGQSSPQKHRWTGLKGGRHAGAHPRAHARSHAHMCAHVRTVMCLHTHAHAVTCTHTHAHNLHSSQGHQLILSRPAPTTRSCTGCKLAKSWLWSL